MPPAPSSLAILAQGGIRPAQSFERPLTTTPSGLAGNPIDQLVSGGKNIIGAVDEKAKKLETALTAILVLSGIAAVAGVVNLLRSR